MKWPIGMEPENVPVYARNEIVIAAPPPTVWRWLCRAELWPSWYSNCSAMTIDSPPGHHELESGTEFTWKTFGAQIHSRVLVFEPNRELGWDAHGILTAYHGWTLESEDSGCRVITEETQRGFVPTIARWYLRGMLVRGHQTWVEELKRVAEVGAPPTGENT